MKRKEGSDIRNFCSESTCNIVETGINLLTFLSCKSCKKECSPALKERLEKYNQPKQPSPTEEYEGWFI